MQNPKNPYTMLSKKERGVDKSWMGQAEQSIQHVRGLAELKQIRHWENRPAEFTLLPENLGMHCCEWPAGKASVEVQMLV